MSIRNIRNFCIIAHVDHGKSTLADRFLELTGTVEKRKMHEQYLDQMDLERERGITIKLQPVRMIYKIPMGKFQIPNNPQISNSNDQKNLGFGAWDLGFSGSEQEFVLNLIDTPGHVDFSYEVSRSLAAVEGAILLVDATKGVQAQTLANLHFAQKQGLTVIPAVNKIDMSTARTAEVKESVSTLLNVAPEEILEISGKVGTNVDTLLRRIIERVPSPDSRSPMPGSRLKALTFDSTFDPYKGVIAFVRVFEGSVRRQDKVLAWATKARFDVLEVGTFAPQLTVGDSLSAGDIGYIATGLKNPEQIKVGDTITLVAGHQSLTTDFTPLSGYKDPTPMVYASFFPENSDDYDVLRDALNKLKLTDASLVYEPESSAGLGRGFRLGFLGMLHVEIVSERLKREFSLSLVISTPSVEYGVRLSNGERLAVRSAAALPDPSRISFIEEPMVLLEVLTPSQYVGSVLDLVSTVRNTYVATEYLGKDTAVIKYEVPLAEILTDFYDKLKSVSSGYASMAYEPNGMVAGDLVRLDILIAGDIVEAFSRIVPRSSAYGEARAMAKKLKDVIPPQLFEVAIQVAVGGKVIARETIRAKRKDVTGYLYGGDVTRKMKLLKKQKRGKEKLKERGRVNIPHEVYLKMLKR